MKSHEFVEEPAELNSERVLWCFFMPPLARVALSFVLGGGDLEIAWLIALVVGSYSLVRRMALLEGTLVVIGYLALMLIVTAWTINVVALGFPVGL